MIEHSELTIERWYDPDGPCAVFLIPSGHPGKFLRVSEDPNDHDICLLDQTEVDRLRAHWQDKQLVCRQHGRLKQAAVVAYPHGDELTDEDRVWADRVMAADTSAENGYYELALLGPGPERQELDHENMVR